MHQICFKSKNPVHCLPHTTQNLSATVSHFEPNPLATSRVDYYRGLFCRRESDNKPSWQPFRDPKALEELFGVAKMMPGRWRGFSCHSEWGGWARHLKPFSGPAARTWSVVGSAATQHLCGCPCPGHLSPPSSQAQLSQPSCLQQSLLFAP